MKRHLSIFGLLFFILSIVPICTSQMALVSENFDIVKLENVTFRNFAPPSNSGVVESDANYNIYNNVEFTNNTATHNSSLILTKGSKNIFNGGVFNNNTLSNGSHLIQTDKTINNISNEASKKIAPNSCSPFVFVVFLAIFVIILAYILPGIELLKITLINRERHGLLAYLSISIGFICGKYTFLKPWIPENMHIIHWLVISFIWLFGLCLVWIQEPTIRTKIAKILKLFH